MAPIAVCLVNRRRRPTEKLISKIRYILRTNSDRGAKPLRASLLSGWSIPLAHRVGERLLHLSLNRDDVQFFAQTCHDHEVGLAVSARRPQFYFTLKKRINQLGVSVLRGCLQYLRIIYGPEYLLPENLERFRSRNVGAKRSLASREFALGIEALERAVRKEPLRLTHECVFGVLALESEPIDPRL